MHSVESRKQLNGADIWAADQMFAKNDNTPIAVMSNSTRQN